MQYCCPPGKNIVHQITVTLEELYNGATRKLAVPKNTICDRCEGMFLLKSCLDVSEMCVTSVWCKLSNQTVSPALFIWQVVEVVKEQYRCACLVMAQGCKSAYTSYFQVWYSRCPQCATAAKDKEKESAKRTAAKHAEAGRSYDRRRSWRSTLTKVREM